MTNCFWYLICILAGLLLGKIYFTWLLKKTEMLTSYQNLHIWLFHSLSRFGLLIICFYLLSGHNWQNWVACLVGWTSMKIIVLLKVVRELNSTIGSAT